MNTTHYSFILIPLLLASCLIIIMLGYYYYPAVIGSYYCLSFFIGIAVFYFLRSLKISITGKGVLITGCDSGFGHHLAIRLSQAGFTVFACCMDDQSEGGKKLKSLQDANVEKTIHVIRMDVTKQKQVDDALKFVENHLPKSGLWGLVNNAGVGSIGFIEWLSMEHFEQVAEVNLFGAIRVTKAFVPLIRKSKGRIVNVSSVLGRSSPSRLSAYCITKYGVEAFSNVLRREMRQFDVKVCTIQPGLFVNATGIIGGPGGAQRMINQLWDDLNLCLQDTYGRQCIDDYKASLEWSFHLSAEDTEPVTNAMMDCVCRLYPKTHYLIASSLMEKTLVYSEELLPACIMDPVISFIETCIIPFLLQTF